MSIPTNYCRLEDVASFMGGGTPSRNRPQYFGGGIPWVKTTDLNNGLITQTEETLTTFGLKSSSCRLIPAKAVLVAMYGGLKQIGRTGLLAHESAINQAMTAVLPDTRKLLPEFLLEWLNFRVDYWKRFAASSRKDPNITKSDVADFPVPEIPVGQQSEICNVLGTWNFTIIKTERLIAAKEKGFAWLVKELIDKNGNRWEHPRADRIFKSISERGNGTAELLSVTQEKGVIPRSMLEGRVMSPGGGTESYKLIKPGDFAISLRSFQGGIEYSHYQGLISPAYTVLRPRLKIADEFYRHFFKSYLFIEKYLSIAVIGIRDGKQISIPDFMSVKIPYPPLEQQRYIAEVLNTARQEIDILKKQAEAYRRQKRGLMQKLLTGEWRVKQ